MVGDQQFYETNYRNCDLDSLLAEYQRLCVGPQSLQETVADYIWDYLNPQYTPNLKLRKTALVNVLRELTGRDYRVADPQKAVKKVTTYNVIDYLCQNYSETAIHANLIVFSNNLKHVGEEKKMKFIMNLSLDKELFDHFMQELYAEEKPNKVYRKYRKLAHKAYKKHHYTY